jgi:hypothetical protein
MFVSFFLMAVSSGVFAQTPNLPYGVDLRDVHQHAPGSWPDAEAILADITAHPHRYAAGHSFNPLGTSRIRSSEIQGVEIPEPAVRLRDGRYSYEANVTFLERGVMRLRRHQVILGGPTPRVDSVHLVREHDLSDVELEITVGLYDRAAVLRAPSVGLFKIYPLGVGMIDPGVTVASRGRTLVVTPTLRNARLYNRYMESARHDGHFRGLPFMPIRTSEDGILNVAFHGNTGSGGVRSVERGFVSNGCMRMRRKDVIELFDLLKHSSRDHFFRVNILPRLEENVFHPFPMLNAHYQVTNLGTAESPRSVRSSRGGGRRLRISHRVESAPPGFEELEFIDGDHMTEREHREYAELLQLISEQELLEFDLPVENDPRAVGA